MQTPPECNDTELTQTLIPQHVHQPQVLKQLQHEETSPTNKDHLCNIHTSYFKYKLPSAPHKSSTIT